MVHEGPSGRHVDPVLAATPEDGSRDGIEFRRPSRGHVLLHRTSQSGGSPSGAARTNWGVSFASSAMATEQASVTHDFRREYQLASDRTAPSVPPRPLLPGQTAPESTACPKASSPGRPEPRSSTPQHAAHRTVAPPALASWGWGATSTFAKGESWQTRPGSSRSASTRMVPGKTRSCP